MGLNVHVIECTNDVSTAPTAIGQHWVNTSNGKQWFSKGTSSVADWILLNTLPTIAHSATTGQTANDHHNELHTIASHSDTTATGIELNTLTDGSNADSLHSHVGSGDVTAGANIADNRIVRGDGGAKGIQQSGWTIDDLDCMSVSKSKSGYLFDINNSLGSGGGNGAKICGGELLGDIALKVCDANGTFDILEIEADQGALCHGKSYAQTIIDNGVAYGYDNQLDSANFRDINTQLGIYRIGGQAVMMGTYFQDASSESESSTTSTSEQTKLTLTTPNLPSGKYRIGWYFETNGSSGSQDVEVQVYDGATVLSRVEEAPEDSDAWKSESGFSYRSAISGVRSIKIKYKTQNSGATARIRRARLEIWRIS